MNENKEKYLRIGGKDEMTKGWMKGRKDERMNERKEWWKDEWMNDSMNNECCFRTADFSIHSYFVRMRSSYAQHEN